ncbi:alpha/beta fold hydrolase [Streptomyces sp. NPDC058872]|uniref:alpha/beta fold hydrolase n=1 Tax=Streptomyces sp. NPDC058872 TaxID=3346661 RepID=UPI00369F28DC
MSYAEVNGLSLYVEEHGSGEPLVLLHGGLGSAETFAPLVPRLAEAHRVILVDLQGHGRTADIDRPLRPELMADDIAALLKHLGVERADLLGYSTGADVALQVAVRHPRAVRRLVVVSTPCKRDGWHSEVIAAMDGMSAETAEVLRDSPVHRLYDRLAPRPEDWTVLVGKTAELKHQDYDWTTEVSTITAPALLVFGDADAVRPAHMVEFYALLGGGLKDAGFHGADPSGARLAVLPGASHYDVLAHPALTGVVTAFLSP